MFDSLVYLRNLIELDIFINVAFSQIYLAEESIERLASHLVEYLLMLYMLKPPCTCFTFC